MKRVWILMSALLLLPVLAHAAAFQLKPDLKVVLPEVATPWSVSTEPPAELVDHLTEHVLEDAQAQGKTPTPEQARDVALKRARSNQLFVTNVESGAHLLISFSPLEQGETPPSAKTVALSAKYAADGVADEGWTEIKTEQAAITIKGAQQAQWFTIDYRHGGERSQFLGIVGFAQPYWFWLYGNDHLKNPADRAVLEQLMRGIEIVIVAQ